MTTPAYGRYDVPGYDVPGYIAVLSREGELLAAAAERAGMGAAVPSCPDWAVRDLLKHTGYVHRWATGFVAGGLRRPSGGASEAEILGQGPGDAELTGWFRRGHAALVRALSQAPPDLDCWAFLPAPSPLAFWARRQAHETAIHRVDAEQAAGRAAASAFQPMLQPTFEAASEPSSSEPASETVSAAVYEPASEALSEPSSEPASEAASAAVFEPASETVSAAVYEPASEALSEAVSEPSSEPASEAASAAVFEPAFAADGVDELIMGFLARNIRRGSWPGLAGSLAIHAADGAAGGADWLVAGGSAEPGVSRGTGRAGCDVTGPARDLYLMLWNRRPPDGLQVTGDPGILAALTSALQVTW